PRRFALVAFGGAAGLHVTEVARLLEIRRVVVPSVAAVLSAWGMLATDLRYELVRSHVSEVGRMTAAGLRKLFATLEREGRKRLARFDGPVTVRRAVDMRYGEQIFEIQVDLDGVDLQAADLMEQVAERFHRRHEALYAYSAPGQEVVVVNARVAVVGALPVLPAGAGAVGRGGATSSARRRVWLGDWVEAALYCMEALTAGLEVKGPAIFESATTTVLVRESERVAVTPHGLGARPVRRAGARRVLPRRPRPGADARRDAPGAASRHGCRRRAHAGVDGRDRARDPDDPARAVLWLCQPRGQRGRPGRERRDGEHPRDGPGAGQLRSVLRGRVGVSRALVRRARGRPRAG